MLVGVEEQRLGVVRSHIQKIGSFVLIILVCLHYQGQVHESRQRAHVHSVTQYKCTWLLCSSEYKETEGFC